MAAARPRSLAAVARAAQRCTACPLYQHATQTVFGEGPAPAAVMLVGEQPGDREDVAGHPFVGPAGALLDAVMEEAEVPRADVYITNAVKHFSFIPRGKLRLHKKPTAREVRACQHWLTDEIAFVKPRVIVALGATAAEALTGTLYKVTKDRGKPLETPHADALVLTYHPSAVLRAPDPDARAAVREALIHDLRVAWRAARRAAPG